MKIHALIYLVVIMGFLILASLGFLAYGLVSKFTESTKRLEPLTEPETIVLPDRAEIRETSMHGNRILMRLILPKGGSRLIIYDMKEGKVIQQIEIESNS